MTTTPTPPPKPPTLRRPTQPSLPQVATPPPPDPNAGRAAVSFGKIDDTPTAHRIVLYGPGGIGKTTLCARLPGPVAFIDLEDSLDALKTNLREQGLIDNIVPVRGVTDWKSLRAALNGSGWDGIKSIVIDSGTKAEDMGVAHTIATVKTAKGTSVTSIEGYGWGVGYTHTYETFIGLLSDLDRHKREGRHVAIICHDCTAKVPNPEGEDFLRYEPRLQSPKNGNASIRLKVREWADHVLFLGYDVVVDKGVAKGSGTRTLYGRELPHCMAKSRTLRGSVPINDDDNVWNLVIPS